MPKLVIDVKIDGVLNNDSIIAYDAKNKCWIAKPKSSFLAEHINENNKKFSDINEKIEKLNKICDKNSKNIVDLAKILKK